MGVFQHESTALLRAGVDRMLQSEAVMGALRYKVGRYADILELRCAEEKGITARVRLRGFSEEVRITLRRVEAGEGGTWLRPVDIFADREGVDALLKDMVLGKTFELPTAARPFAGVLAKLFDEKNS
ncbi:hypothetical protein [Mailhella massiliensis]|uniref:Uncharacterized protein n=1 Tax=Mailhella massiliensis TaxID=1903261 RepID=A0A921AWP7_9BACT|nr:hypothetical protein [Mailhella massiliensis]HJD97451.1 hypothetical protein [Mailhella massiliensis]